MPRKKYTEIIRFDEIAPKMMTLSGFKHYAELARFLEITPQSLNKFRVDNRFPTNLIVKFARKNRSSLDELLAEFLNIPTTKEEGGSDSLIIRYPAAELGNIQNIFMEAPKSWVQENFGAGRDDLGLWIMKSDNMIPTIERNSLLLIDKRSKSIKGGGIFAFKSKGQVMIKRVQERLDGTFEIVNDNRAYESYSISAQDLSKGGFEVLGKVVFVGKPM
jgi:hypothetical protein